MPEYVRQGQTRRKTGRKAYGPLEEVAGLPNRQEREQGWNHQSGSQAEP